MSIRNCRKFKIVIESGTILGMEIQSTCVEFLSIIRNKIYPIRRNAINDSAAYVTEEKKNNIRRESHDKRLKKHLLVSFAYDLQSKRKLIH